MYVLGLKVLVPLLSFAFVARSEWSKQRDKSVLELARQTAGKAVMAVVVAIRRLQQHRRAGRGLRELLTIQIAQATRQLLVLGVDGGPVDVQLRQPRLECSGFVAPSRIDSSKP